MKQIKLEELNYCYDELCPNISKTTLEFHHDKHLASYVEKANTAIEKEGISDKSLVDILTNLSKISKANATEIRNNGGGVFNHNFYFEALTAKASSEPSECVVKLIEKDFDTMEKFKEEFKQAGMSQFGSGWAWLVLNGEKLEIIKTANQDTPLEKGLYPILTMDVWEHAYYLDYQNRRDLYIDAFLEIINWDIVEKRLRCVVNCCNKY